SSGLGGSPRRPCRGERQSRQSLRRESRDQEGDAGSLSGLSTPLQAPVPVSQLVIHERGAVCLGIERGTPPRVRIKGLISPYEFPVSVGSQSAPMGTLPCCSFS